MITKISRTEEIMGRLRREGKVTVLDSPEDMEAMNRMNESLERTHREFIVKQFNSEKSAANIIFTA